MASQRFESYKAALRRGHRALIDGDLERAVEAYAEAARLVPDRPLPHAGAAGALLRLGRPEEALAALDRALAVAPDDPPTLRVQVATLRELGREADAVAAAEHLRVVELGAAVVGHAGPGADEAPTDGWPAIDLPSPTPVPPAGPPPDPEGLLAKAASALEAGDRAAARDHLLVAVEVHRAAGRPDAALDACFQLLAISPGDPAIHLALAGVQLDRGWQAIAADKLQLLLRLTALTGDTRAAADAHALAAERLRDEPAGVASPG